MGFRKKKKRSENRFTSLSLSFVFILLVEISCSNVVGRDDDGVQCVFAMKLSDIARAYASEKDRYWCGAVGSNYVPEQLFNGGAFTLCCREGKRETNYNKTN